MFDLEESRKKCQEFTESLFNSLKDEDIDDAIRKGVKDGLENSKPFEGQWIDQDGNPVEAPNWSAHS
tara:strand:+ start:8004 stop:8204 length:201 start_codon:yes stop_codon:yes gene_type:complete